MAIGNFVQSELNTEVTAVVSGTFTATNFLTVANRAVRAVMSEIDLRSSKRSSALSPNLFDDSFQYTLPSDIKGDKIIDIKPQLNRGRFDDWVLTTPEEFDRMKRREQTNSAGDRVELRGGDWLGDNLISISRDDLVNKLLISRPIDDTQTIIDSLDSVGDWEGFGDGDNLTADNTNVVKGSASINWDINADGGTTAGIVNDSLTDFDVSLYKTNGSIFVWAYVSSATDLTNFIILIGSSSSAYYKITVTTDNAGASFVAGWNLLRFDFINKSTTGTPTDDETDYVALYMTKDSGKVSETDYRFDHIIMKLGDHYNVQYYSRFPWQSSTGSYLEDATTTTDVLNVETDEYNLIILKTSEFMEEFLNNFKEADRLGRQYEFKKAEYIQTNPSQALVTETTYYIMDDQYYDGYI